MLQIRRRAYQPRAPRSSAQSMRHCSARPPLPRPCLEDLSPLHRIYAFAGSSGYWGLHLAPPLKPEPRPPAENEHRAIARQA